MKDYAEGKGYLNEGKLVMYPRKTIAPYWLLLTVIALAAALGGALYAGKVYAEPVYKGQKDDLILTLYSEPCQLKEHVTNLPGRITWEEKGQKYEGCFTVHPSGFVVAYFAGDKTVAVIPAEVFVKVQGV